MDNSADSDRKARRKKVEQPQEGSDDQGMKADGDMSAIADPGHKPLIGEARIDATIDRVAEELFSREQTRFSAVQAAIWIATGRLDLVEMTGANESIRDSSITEASLDMERILREFQEAGLDWANNLPGSPLLGPAVQKLQSACEQGKLSMFGRLGNVGASTEVPTSAWGGIQIIDDHQHGVIAAPSDRHRPGVAWWGGLTLNREKVQQLWRVETTSTSSPPSELLALDPAAPPQLASAATIADSKPWSPTCPREVTYSPNKVPDTDRVSFSAPDNDKPPDDAVVSAWLVLEQERRLKEKIPCGLNEVRLYLRERFSHLTRNDTDRFYKALDSSRKPNTGPKGPWKNKPPNQ